MEQPSDDFEERVQFFESAFGLSESAARVAAIGSSGGSEREARRVEHEAAKADFGRLELEDQWRRDFRGEVEVRQESLHEMQASLDQMTDAELAMGPLRPVTQTGRRAVRTAHQAPLVNRSTASSRSGRT